VRHIGRVQLYDISYMISTSVILQRWRSNLATADMQDSVCIATRCQGQSILIGAINGKFKELCWQALARHFRRGSFSSYLHIVSEVAFVNWLSCVIPRLSRDMPSPCRMLVRTPFVSGLRSYRIMVVCTNMNRETEASEYALTLSRWPDIEGH
jgi:hypothetical protein